MNTNEEVWGDPYWSSANNTMNVRTGVSGDEDSDYEDYPPFIANAVPNISDYPTSLYQYVENQRLSLNAEIDKSICHIGFDPRSGAPQLDITAWTYDVWTGVDPSGEPSFKIKDGADVSYMLCDNYVDRTLRTPKVATSTGNVWKDDYTLSPYGLYKQYVNWSPNAEVAGTLGDTDTEGLINRNLRQSTYRNWGMRTIYLVINVVYKTNRAGEEGASPTLNPTTSTRTLGSYFTQTEEWRSTRPIVGAFAVPYTRIGKTGGYSNIQTSGTAYNRGNHGVFPEFVTEYEFDGVERLDFRLNLARDTQLGFYPLYGYIGLGVSGTSTIPASIGTAAMPVFLGANNGIRRSSTNKVIWTELDGTSQDTYEYIMSACAMYGMYFADDTYSLASSGQDTTRWTDPNMCLPVISDQGYTDGRYTKGAYNVTNSAYEWKDIQQSPYTPGQPPIPQNEYNTQTVFNSIGDLATMTRRYVLRGSEVQQLGSALWSISEALSDSGTDFTELTPKVIDQFLTNNPIDCIISLQRYPMTIPAVGTTTVKLGKTDTGIAAKPMERTAYFYLFSGSTINSKFGDSFLDYNPYTKMELYVPFCGTMQLNPADIIGRQLNVQLVVDFTTGTATGFIMSDDLVIETVNGNIAIDIPVTGIQAATVASQLNNAIANKSNKTLEAQSASLGNVSLGGLFRMISDPVKTLKAGEIAENEETRAEYDLTHQNAPIHIIGAASAVGGWAIDLQCRLIIYYPSGDVIRTGQPPEWNSQQLAMYGRTTGFACCIEGSIGSMNTGLVVGTSPDLNGMVTNASGYPATAAELDMLRAAISEGVIL